MQKKSAKTTHNKPIESYQSFIENQNNCPLCSTELVIHVEVSKQDQSLKEQAKCPSCDLVARVKDHNLH